MHSKSKRHIPPVLMHQVSLMLMQAYHVNVQVGAVLGYSGDLGITEPPAQVSSHS